MVRHDHGFTLLECLIALAILAGTVVGLQRGIGAGWAAVRIARTHSEALAYATTLLATAGVATPLQEGATRGETADGYRWAVTVTRPITDDGETGRGRPRVGGFWVDVTVETGTASAPGRGILLRTFKLTDGKIAGGRASGRQP